MNLLLDTHSFLWFVLGGARLSVTAQAAVRDHENSVLASLASYRELAIKVSTGKSETGVECEEVWNDGIYDNGFRALPMTPLHAATLIPAAVNA